MTPTGRAKRVPSFCPEPLFKITLEDIMTCRHSILLLTLAMVAVAATPLAAHEGDRVFPIRYLSEETLALLDLGDASVEDWEDAVGEPTLTLLDFTLDSKVNNNTISYDQLDPSNLDFRIWLGWSRDGKIHAAGQFADDVYENEYGSDPHGWPIGACCDHMAFLVDGDHSGGQYFFGPRPMQAQQYDAISRAPSGLPMIDFSHNHDEKGAHIEWMSQPPFASAGGGVVGENPTFWVVEFFATCFDRMSHPGPEDSEVSQLSEGRIIGFDIRVVDHDLPNSRRAAIYRLADPEAKAWESADGFVDGLLLGSGAEFGDSAVRSVSWARIKAALEMDLRSEDSFSDKD